MTFARCSGEDLADIHDNLVDAHIENNELPDRSFACNFTRAKFLHAKRGIIFLYYKNACEKFTLSRVNFCSVNFVLCC